jgi:hypothetical protein
MVLIHRSDVVGVDLHFPNFSPPNSINFRPNLKIFEPVVVFFVKNRRVHLPGYWSMPAPATCSPRSISTFPIRVRVLAWSHPPPVNPSPQPSSVPYQRTRAQANPRPHPPTFAAAGHPRARSRSSSQHAPALPLAAAHPARPQAASASPGSPASATIARQLATPAAKPPNRAAARLNRPAAQANSNGLLATPQARARKPMQAKPCTRLHQLAPVCYLRPRAAHPELPLDTHPAVPAAPPRQCLLQHPGSAAQCPTAVPAANIAVAIPILFWYSLDTAFSPKS